MNVGAEPADRQALRGRANLATTRIYTPVDQGRMAAAVNRLEAPAPAGRGRQ